MEQLVGSLHRSGGCDPSVMFVEDIPTRSEVAPEGEQLAVMCVERSGKMLFATTRALQLRRRWNEELDLADPATSLLRLPNHVDALYQAAQPRGETTEPAQTVPSGRWSLWHPTLLGLLLTVDTDGRQAPGAAHCCLLWLEERPVMAQLLALSPSERRVARLVAQGLRNYEIAEMLCRSRRTVEFQLNSIYRKLGITCRTQLVRALL